MLKRTVLCAVTLITALLITGCTTFTKAVSRVGEIAGAVAGSAEILEGPADDLENLWNDVGGGESEFIDGEAPGDESAGDGDFQEAGEEQPDDVDDDTNAENEGERPGPGNPDPDPEGGGSAVSQYATNNAKATCIPGPAKRPGRRDLTRNQRGTAPAA